MSRNNLASVVLPEEETPDMPTIRALLSVAGILQWVQCVRLADNSPCSCQGRWTHLSCFLHVMEGIDKRAKSLRCFSSDWLTRRWPGTSVHACCNLLLFNPDSNLLSTTSQPLHCADSHSLPRESSRKLSLHLVLHRRQATSVLTLPHQRATMAAPPDITQILAALGKSRPSP